MINGLPAKRAAYGATLQRAHHDFGVRHHQHTVLAVALALAVTSGGPRAELVDIAWDKAGRFETVVSVAPGKFAEVCGKLAQGQSVTWSYKADKPMDFNIHYHEGKRVVFPAKQDAAIDAQGKLDVKLRRGYCWMWTSTMDVPVQIELLLQR